MSWEDRLIEAAYTSPSGIRQTFLYEDVSFNFDKKTAAFSFAGADGTFIQDLGKTDRKYPFKVIISGADYDIQANAFIELLGERGIGRLEHPIYGLRNVVPFGKIRRQDNLKSAGNEAIIQVEFWETIGIGPTSVSVVPSADRSPADEILNALEEYQQVTPVVFNDSVKLGTAVESSSFNNNFKSELNAGKGTLQKIANTTPTVGRKFNNIFDAINADLDTVGSALDAAFQTIIWLEEPGRSVTLIQAKLNAYGNLLQDIIDRGTALLFPGSDDRVPNKFYIESLFATTYVIGSVNSILFANFETKPQALDAAGQLLDQMDRVTVWRDDNYESLELVDTGEDYQKLLEAVTLAAGFLVDLSFTLRQEYTIVLTRNRTIIDLEAELYGTVDENLDFLISTNSLTGDEILELKRGREIVYYV